MAGKLNLDKPDADALHVAAIQCWQVGDMVGACALWRQAIALNPDAAVYHANLGVALKQLGTGQERIACYQRAIQLAPEEPDYHSNLAAALNEAERYVEGEAEARLAIVFLPTRAESWFNLGSSLAGQYRWLDAAAAFDMAGRHRDAWPDALEAAGEAWRSAGDWPRAASRFQNALQGLPVQPIATRVRLLRAWAEALMRMHRYADAEVCLRDALALDSDSAELLTDLGNALKAQNCFDEALVHYRRVIELRPDLAGGYCNLGTVAQSLGDYETAIAYYRKTLEISPSLEPAWTNLGNCLTYSPKHEPKDVLAIFQAFDSQLAQPLFDARHHFNGCNTRRRLKVGYVSADFRKHAVAYFALPLIEGHRRDQIEVFCYYNHRQDDEWTAAFRRAADHWLDCSSVSDAELAERIRADEIDILVDLAGHTENNRLLVFARKPAPVQVTWMGYVTTTGLSAMDWRVTHANADPDGVDRYYSEKLWRLPGTMWCYRPLPGMPEVTSAPVLRNGYVTFGSFNRYSKNSPLVLETWAAILNQVPDSRLVICVPEGSIRERMARFFAERGIHSERILAFAKVSHDDFWKLHGEVDIALDSFPFAGGTTTCETLWLGVPLVTVTGSAQSVTDESQTFPARFASRMGLAFLTNIGVPELVAETLPQYVNIAVQLAGDVPRLVQLRQSLRSCMAAAPLTDEARFVREMEQAYREMWRQWCVQQSTYEKSENSLMKTFLHVGCGPKRKDKTTPGFNVPEWQELRLDIDKNVAPDIVGTMLDMSAVADASVDALFSSHNIEHLYPHEVPKALSEFKRVLKPDGFVVITCPDLQSVCALIAEDKLTDPAYDSPAGPITPLDILYGFRPAMAHGNLYMAHRCGFTQKVLTGTLQAAGFATVAATRREHPSYDLWALATVQSMVEPELRVLASAHFPK